jgi:hypothetical protein
MATDHNDSKQSSSQCICQTNASATKPATWLDRRLGTLLHISARVTGPYTAILVFLLAQASHHEMVMAIAHLRAPGTDRSGHWDPDWEPPPLNSREGFNPSRLCPPP